MTSKKSKCFFSSNLVDFLFGKDDVNSATCFDVEFQELEFSIDGYGIQLLRAQTMCKARERRNIAVALLGLYDHCEHGPI